MTNRVRSVQPFRQNKCDRQTDGHKLTAITALAYGGAGKKPK